MELSNNVILITGGTSGIGLALAKELLNLNNTVIILGRKAEKLKALQAIGFETVICDFKHTETIKKAAEYINNTFPSLNMLFNNAGIQYNYLFTETWVTHGMITEEITVNFTSQVLLTQLLLPTLKTQNKAYIINTTSGLGAFPKSDGLIYSASKAAMRNFTVGLRYALKNTSVKAIDFIPPVTKTNMTKGREEALLAPEFLIQGILPQLKRGANIVTVFKMRLFLWIAFLFPNLAYKVINK